MKLTIIISKGSDGYLIGQIKEIPAVITQGMDEIELMDNIKDALDLYLEDMREEYTDVSENFISEKELILS